MVPTTEEPHILRSARRALRILGVVYRSGEGKQLREVSAETGFDKATTLRILSTIVAEGIIRRDPVTGRYGPDMRSWLYLARSVQPGLLLVSAMQTGLDRLTQAIGHTSGIFLPTQDGRSSAAPLWSHARTALRYQPASLPVVPLHASAPGRCVLAARTSAELARYLQRPLERLTQRTITSPTKLRRELARIRRLGYATHVGEVSTGVSAIAMPLKLAGGEVVGAVALAIPGEQVSESVDGALPALIEAQQFISHLFGYQAWLELVQASDPAVPPSPSPWDTPDPSFDDGSLPLVRAVSRMLRLMAAVLRQPEGASVRELARQRGLDKTTTWRLLNTLRAGDVLRQDGPDDRYRVSPGFWLRHANIMRAATSLTRLVAGILQEVALTTGATAVLALPDKEMRNSVTCQFALPHTPLCYHPEYNPAAPLHVTATGKTYLAAQSRLGLEKYIRRGLAALTGRSITSRGQLLAELELVRETGYALNREEMVDGVAACAVPVYDPVGSIAGSVAIVPLASALAQADVAKWVQVLQDAAKSLSQLLVGEWREQLQAPAHSSG